MYLDSEIRRNVSNFALATEDEFADGLARLHADLESGAWDRRYGHLRSLPELDLGHRLLIRRPRVISDEVERADRCLSKLLPVPIEFRPERLLVPVITPFDAADRVDEEALERHADEVLAAGAAGTVALATTGEATSLDAAERAAVISICARVCAARDAVLVIGAGTYNTRETIARHEALADVPGVRASLAVVPYYVRPSEAAIVAHFTAVAARSPVPVIIYNIPYRTARGLGSAALLELAATDNVVGVKQAVGGIDADTLQVLAEAPRSFSVLGGDDAFLLPLILMGGAGAIAASANVATDRYAAMIDDGLAGRLADGRRNAEALLPLSLALFAEPSPAVIKGVLHAQGKIPTSHVRMPLAEASPVAVEQALAVLDSLAVVV